MTTEPRAEHAAHARPVELTISQEQLEVATEWAVAGRVLLRRRIVTEMRTVEVQVRREVLVVETQDAAVVGDVIVPVGDVATGRLGSPALARTTTVVVLREEVPVVGVEVRAYEQVRATVFRIGEQDRVDETLRHEEFVVD